MSFNDFKKIILEELKQKIENNKALYVFARERAKFEGWLKVELCNILAKHFEQKLITPELITPEKDRIDVVINDWAFELKTTSTNYKYNMVVKKVRPITDNINGILNDIKKLKTLNYSIKAVLFVVYPAEHDNRKWKQHREKIDLELNEKLEFIEFKFQSEIPGIIYIGIV